MGKGSSLGNIFLVSTKLESFCYLTVLRAVVLTQYRHVTDGRTHGQTDRRNCRSQYTACNASIAARCKNHHSSVGLHGQRNESMRQVLKSGCGIVFLMSPANRLYTYRPISVLSPLSSLYIIDLYHTDGNNVTTTSNDIHVFMTQHTLQQQQ